jgi:hypothetical protein
MSLAPNKEDARMKRRAPPRAWCNDPRDTGNWQQLFYNTNNKDQETL